MNSVPTLSLGRRARGCARRRAEALHRLSSLERRSPRWDSDPESARAALGAAISLVWSKAGGNGEGRRVRADLDQRIKNLATRWFLMRNVHSEPKLALLQPRQTISLLRGPMTRAELVRSRDLGASGVRGAAHAQVPALSRGAAL